MSSGRRQPCVRKAGLGSFNVTSSTRRHMPCEEMAPTSPSEARVAGARSWRGTRRLADEVHIPATLPGDPAPDSISVAERGGCRWAILDYVSHCTDLLAFPPLAGLAVRNARAYLGCEDQPSTCVSPAVHFYYQTKSYDRRDTHLECPSKHTREFIYSLA